MAVQQVLNTVFNVVTAIHNLIKSGYLIWKSLENMWDACADAWNGLFDDSASSGKKWYDMYLQKENCADMFAAIAGCFLNKFLGPYIDEFKEKATSLINEAGKSMNDLIYDELSDINLYAAYANREAFLLEKAAIQLNGYSDVISSFNSSSASTQQQASQPAQPAQASASSGTPLAAGTDATESKSLVKRQVLEGATSNVSGWGEREILPKENFV
jgi:hypothetical protein